MEPGYLEREVMAEVGNTPLVRVDGIYAKLECCNPCGSVKDRIGKYIIDKSEQLGLLKPGMTIIEATSGNTGIALTHYARDKGYDVIIVMPENMTDERKAIMRDLGAELILCAAGDFKEAASIRDRLAAEKGYFNTDQFSNPLNVDCHYETTGREIIEAMRPKTVDTFVAGVGTGGTLIGVARALREVNPAVRIVAVEPSESAVMGGEPKGAHGIPGIGDGFIPAIASDGDDGLNELIDEVVSISSEGAKEAARELADRHSFCVGISSGANFLAAKKFSEPGNVVTVFPDGYSKYVSQGLVSMAETCPQKDRCKRRLKI